MDRADCPRLKNYELEKRKGREKIQSVLTLTPVFMASNSICQNEIYGWAHIAHPHIPILALCLTPLSLIRPPPSKLKRFAILIRASPEILPKMFVWIRLCKWLLCLHDELYFIQLVICSHGFIYHLPEYEFIRCVMGTTRARFVGGLGFNLLCVLQLPKFQLTPSVKNIVLTPIYITIVPVYDV